MTPSRLAHFRALLESRLVVATGIVAGREARASRDRAVLLALESALARIDAGHFGRCLACDAAIPERQLLLRPHVERCLACEPRRSHHAAIREAPRP